MIAMKENQASASTIVADKPVKNRYACKIACIAEFFYQNLMPKSKPDVK